ncbi:MAG TPA: iron-containing alcohol dehydrogenase [Firmicutes bacterium]|jgi:alcohol dehydrogenase class IV|nr:iron-containing alcohol dehydrogenase family protein [Bacillota bacterium]HHT43678.1 iron-containing alcohol dehydrogenase [Bacillota bacterium]
MRKFNFSMPTKIVFGQDVVKDAGESLALGKKALIVTGKTSARLSGALDDVLSVLPGEYVIFDEVENNPTGENCAQGARLAREEGCDYIIAIGGGSPLDAAKVMAVLAVNDKQPLELYGGWEHKALPIAAIPTTAGTGSEVTPYAVLTLHEEETKKGLGGPDLFPAVAYLDAKYTASLPLQTTIDTAVDALSHLVEGYLSNRATPASDWVALQGIALWGTALPALRQGELSLEAREDLLLASMLGGITIAQTGTTMVHALGYPLTYFHDYPHGRANGVLMASYLEYTRDKAPERVDMVLELLDQPSLQAFRDLMDELFADYVGKLHVPEEAIKAYAAKAAKTKNIAYTLGTPSAEELTKILKDNIL